MPCKRTDGVGFLSHGIAILRYPKSPDFAQIYCLHINTNQDLLDCQYIANFMIIKYLQSEI